MITDVMTRTIQCDGPDCPNTASLDPNDQQAAQQAGLDNPWLVGMRIVKTPDGRNLVLCNDVCTVNAVKAGLLNRPEPKKIIEMPQGAEAAIRAAAAQAEAQQRAAVAMKAGEGITLA